MSIRNLDSLFKPRSLALVGASTKGGSLGALLARNLAGAGFDGPIYPVHPKADEIAGRKAYRTVGDLPEAPDLAVLATPPGTVPGLVGELAEAGTRGAVVITAGFGEGGDAEGEDLRVTMLSNARPATLRIVGPNCLGLMVPGIGLNASFSHIEPRSGDLAFVTQSGAMVTAMLDWASPRGIGFSHIVSLGDMSDVDFGDMLDYLALDPDTRAILLYVEAVTAARKFMSAARIAARTKPVIVIKGGRHSEGARAALSHTGALAGSDAVYDTAFRRAGMLRVLSLEELFDAAETLATAPTRSFLAGGGDRLAILTNGGGLGVLATDALIDHGGRLAELAPETVAALNAVLPRTWSRGNPVDIIGDAPGERYAAALSILAREKNADAVLVLNCPTAVASSSEAAEAVVGALDAKGNGREKPVFTSWVGEATARSARDRFVEARVPTYPTPEQAVRAFMHLERYRRNQKLLMETPRSVRDEGAPDSARVRAIFDKALDEGRSWLTEPEAKAVLSAYLIPTVATERAIDEASAGEAAERIGGPVALKILSPDILHKSDVGGVALNLEGRAEVEDAARRMRDRLMRMRPNARLDGFTVQEMIRRPDGHELIIGMLSDAQFGPVILFGQGGTAVEVVRDKALALPPLNMALAKDLMAQTRIYRLLQGYRDRPPAAIDEIAGALINLAQLVIDFAEIDEVDVNPLIADSSGVVAVDARFKLNDTRHLPWRTSPAARLAIRPYPKQLEESFRLPDGQEVFVRPIRPEDGPALKEGFRRMSPEDIRYRFLAPVRTLDETLVARLTQLDYNREMALIAFNPEHIDEEAWGIARIWADPDNETAEFAVIVRSDLKGRGLGSQLMSRILGYAGRRGVREVWGDVLAENTGMLQLARSLGFQSRRTPDDPGVVHVVKTLQ